MQYRIHPKAAGSPLEAGWDDDAWAGADIAELSNVRPESSRHHPRTRVRLLYDHDGIYGIFMVDDFYVRSVATRFNESVCGDSCVEFFVQPKPDRGYINFEMNCGGTLLASYVEDPTRISGGFKKYTQLPPEHGALVRIRHSMPDVVEPEIAEPTTWWNRFFIPFALFEKYVGSLGDIAGQSWRANFYKCADKTSHPHWLSWAPVGELNFHRPQDFQTLLFAR